MPEVFNFTVAMKHISIFVIFLVVAKCQYYSEQADGTGVLYSPSMGHFGFKHSQGDPPGIGPIGSMDYHHGSTHGLISGDKPGPNTPSSNPNNFKIGEMINKQVCPLCPSPPRYCCRMTDCSCCPPGCCGKCRGPSVDIVPRYCSPQNCGPYCHCVGGVNGYCFCGPR